MIWLLLLFFFPLPWLLFLCRKKKKKGKEKTKKMKGGGGGRMPRPNGDEPKTVRKRRREVAETPSREESPAPDNRPLRERDFYVQVTYIWDVKNAFKPERYILVGGSADEFNSRYWGTDPMFDYLLDLEFEAIHPVYKEHTCRNAKKKKSGSKDACPLCDAYMHWAAYHYVLNSKKLYSFDCPPEMMAAFEEDFYNYAGRLPYRVRDNPRYCEYRRRRYEEGKEKREKLSETGDKVAETPKTPKTSMKKPTGGTPEPVEASDNVGPKQEEK